MNIKQDFIEVNVDYYDNTEKQKLSNYSTFNKINNLVKSSVDIPTSEFLTYFLFHRKRPCKRGWKNYNEISKNLNIAISMLKDFIIFNGNSINNPKNVDSQLKYISEYVGESIGISIVNRIHDLTDADWGKLPEFPGKKIPSFDYEILASDRKNIIQIEAKGTSVENNMNKSNSIYVHKNNIINKKSGIYNLRNKYPLPANYRYGTITVLDSRKNGILKSWILDPDFNTFDIDPKHFQLINRMQFLYDWISFIWPRSQITSALSTRIDAIKNLKDPFELNELPLRKRDDEEFNYYPDYFYSRGIAPWFYYKSRVTDGPAGGHVLQLSYESMFFIGIREELLHLATNQNFDNILSYKTETGFITKKVECVFSKGRFKNLKLPDDVLNSVRKIDDYYHIRLEGQLHYSKEGIVFGILPLKSR